MAESHHHSESPFWRSRSGIAFLVLGGVAAFFLLTEHTAHVLGFLPYLFLLACSLMHLFMHHDHDGHGAQNSSTPPEEHRHDRP